MVSVTDLDAPELPLLASAEKPVLDALLNADEYLVTAYLLSTTFSG